MQDENIEMPEAQPAEEKPVAEAPKMTKVRVIRQDKKSVLVEYGSRDRVERVVVPVKSIQKDKVSVADLEAGIPYGLDFSSLEIPKVSIDDLIGALHQHGVWNKEDVLQNHQAALSTLQSLFVQSLFRQLIKLAKNS